MKKTSKVGDKGQHHAWVVKEVQKKTLRTQVQ